MLKSLNDFHEKLFQFQIFEVVADTTHMVILFTYMLYCIYTLWICDDGENGMCSLFWTSLHISFGLPLWKGNAFTWFHFLSRLFHPAVPNTTFLWFFKFCFSLLVCSWVSFRSRSKTVKVVNKACSPSAMMQRLASSPWRPLLDEMYRGT